MFSSIGRPASMRRDNHRDFVRLARGALAVALVVAASLAGTGGATAAQLPGTALDTWTTDGAVEAVLHHNGTVYIGGDFDVIGPRIGHFAKIECRRRRLLWSAPGYVLSRILACLMPANLIAPRSPSTTGEMKSTHWPAIKVAKMPTP